ncbi:hypothetical protein Mal52_26530 [Symmachiella dynata]|uniref:DUF1963 domain-containing protein n=1 Tax=Symmachiella dynata TaxID=2527995 RepID=A0A517ZNW8_9PLAN|nr:DUF1963 domain-containing protein [Symmachiella dynata]QDU44175.1 hypothetical protein Mal52_26530 [Symmachiella dynata]
MPAKKIIQFHAVEQPITEAVTKFGGQPVWIDEPEWPLSESQDEPMMFIGQIAIEPELFPDAQGKMAYLFMTDSEEHGSNTPTWDPDGGENAIVIQPGGEVWVETEPLSEGPTLNLRGPSSTSPREYRVTCVEGYDADFLPAHEQSDLSQAEKETKFGKLEESKIGGTPIFIQSDEFPGDDWQLLFQLYSDNVPFDLHFGDSGIGYGFISADGDEGKFLWQSF